MFKITNQNKFQKEINKMIKLVPEMQVQILKKVSLDTFKDLQDSTPEDTARAKGGWNTTVDGRPSEWKPQLVKGKRGYRKQAFKGSRKIKAGSLINLSNNVEYIIPLDEGHSTQSPNGFTDSVFSRAAIGLRKITKQLSKKRVK